MHSLCGKLVDNHTQCVDSSEQQLESLSTKHGWDEKLNDVPLKMIQEANTRRTVIFLMKYSVSLARK